MLSYRHAFHAGNHADVLKHIVLVQILRYMTQKDKPLMYVDTHAGTGGYRLDSDFAEKTGEYRQGIGLLWERSDLPAPVADYVEQIRAFNYRSKGSRLDFYPGSPWFAQHLLRSIDRLVLCEMHPGDFPLLNSHFKEDARTKVLHEDGYKTLNAVFPPIQKRGLVLIDPSYEQKDEYRWVADNLTKTHKKFPTGTYALWYPVVNREVIDRLEKTLRRSGISRIQLFELGIAPDSEGHGMTASGMIVINPPWTLMAEMQKVLPYLANQLGNGAGHFRAEILAGEKPGSGNQQ